MMFELLFDVRKRSPKHLDFFSSHSGNFVTPILQSPNRRAQTRKNQTVPYGTAPGVAIPQALRARLRSRCPSGGFGHRPKLAFFRVFGPSQRRSYLPLRTGQCSRPERTFTLLSVRTFRRTCPRHFVPGYNRAVPPGQKPFALREPCIKLALMGFQPGENSHQTARPSRGTASGLEMLKRRPIGQPDRPRTRYCSIG